MRKLRYGDRVLVGKRWATVETRDRMGDRRGLTVRFDDDGLRAWVPEDRVQRQQTLLDELRDVAPEGDSGHADGP